MARSLAERGWRVAILTRGYRGEGGKMSRVVEGKCSDAKRDGDEAALLAATLPGTLVIAGSERWRSALLAREGGANVAILDDGHQHRSLSRALNVLLWDERSERSARATFSMGLREPSAGLRRAHILIRMDRGEGAPAAPKEISPGTLVVKARLLLTGGEDLPWGAQVHALSGIADAESFERALAARGLRVTGATRYPDHHAFGVEEIEEAMSMAAGEGGHHLAITAKDYYRTPSLFDEHAAELRVYDLEVEMEESETVLDVIEKALRGEA
jgi:tetraacyldisaccharide 4'-kinase